MNHRPSESPVRASGGGSSSPSGTPAWSMVEQHGGDDGHDHLAGEFGPRRRCRWPAGGA